MFRGGQANPYDEIVNGTTDENLTSENWEMIMNLCDKVMDEGEQGARNVVAALLKRLAHRNPNVQLYTLTLAESLTKNCGIEVHREIASKAFTQGLERIVTDRNTHDKVRKRALALVAEWTGDFENDTTLGIMEQCYENLKSKGYKFDVPTEAPPPDVDDEVRRKEEEELQRVLELSMRDKGGRNWGQYSLAVSNANAQKSSNGSSAQSSSATVVPAATSKSTPSQPATQQPTYGGYVPSAHPAVSDESVVTPAPAAQVQPQAPVPAPAPAPAPAPEPVAVAPAPAVQAPTYTAASPAPSTKSTQDPQPIVTRVKALHTFEPTEPGELGFEKGDIIKVVDRGYKDWWRGQFKGRTGIFPVNYVQALPEPSASELAKEAENEANVFNQAANVDRLLSSLREMDPVKDNLADNEDIQELYRSCMALRPKIVKLIDKYSQKRADLVSMNESFVKARTIFDRMMEDSLARHTGVYDTGGYPQGPMHGFPRPEARGPEYAGPQPYPWGAPGYDKPPPGAYGPYPSQQPPYGPEPQFQGPPPHGYPAQGPVSEPTPYGQRPQSVYPQQQPGSPSFAPAPGPTTGGPPAPYGQPNDLPGYPHQLAQPQTQPQQQPQQGPQPQATLQPEHVSPSVLQMQAQPQAQYQQPPPDAQYQQLPPDAQPPQYQQQPLPDGQSPVQPIQAQPQAQIQAHPQPEVQYQLQPQAQVQPQYPEESPIRPQHIQQQGQPQVQSPQQSQVQQQFQHQVQPEQPQGQAHAEVQPQYQEQAPVEVHQAVVEVHPQEQHHEPELSHDEPISGDPPYPYDPHATYADPNVQLWASYYSQGGTDPTGSVYFFSVPGVKEEQHFVAQAVIDPAHAQEGSESSVDVAAGRQQQHAGENHQQPTAYGASPYANANTTGGGYYGASGGVVQSPTLDSAIEEANAVHFGMMTQDAGLF